LTEPRGSHSLKSAVGKSAAIGNFRASLHGCQTSTCLFRSQIFKFLLFLTCFAVFKRPKNPDKICLRSFCEVQLKVSLLCM